MISFGESGLHAICLTRLVDPFGLVSYSDSLAAGSSIQIYDVMTYTRLDSQEARRSS